MGMSIKEALEYLTDFSIYSPYQEVVNKVSAYIEQMQSEYEARLKADMVAMLEDLKQDIIAEAYGVETDCSDYVVNVADIDKVIQQKINALKADKE